MIRVLIAALFVGHGLVPGTMFGLPYSAQAAADLPFNPSYSWLLGDRRALAFVVALVVTVAFAVAGAGYVAAAGWWPVATIRGRGVAAGVVGAVPEQVVDRWPADQHRAGDRRLARADDSLGAR